MWLSKRQVTLRCLFDDTQIGDVTSSGVRWWAWLSPPVPAARAGDVCASCVLPACDCDVDAPARLRHQLLRGCCREAERDCGGWRETGVT